MIALSFYKSVLTHTNAALQQAAEQAFEQLLTRIQRGETPQVAIDTVMRAFNSQTVAGLEEAFSKVLQSSLGSGELRNWIIGTVTLSERLYMNAKAVAAITQQIIERHTQALHSARELAKTLYEGYGFKDDPLHVTYPLPKYLRIHFDRAQAARLKTPALRAAYLKAIDKANEKDLERALQIAFYERNRYFASRIARTELHRTYTDQQARELMQQPRIEYVQIRLSSKHPKTDICDLHSKLDKYGLGAGVYPKADAPKPPFHPHCYCLLSPKIDLIKTTPKERKNAERTFLALLPPNTARQIAGSWDKLERILKGDVSIEEVFNEGKPAGYRWARVGDLATSLTTSLFIPGDLESTINLAISLANQSARAIGGYNPQVVRGRVLKGLSVGDTLTMRGQTITYLGNGLVRSAKDGKIIREGKMSDKELAQLLAAIASKT